jgi:K+-transporting ATPase ATPase C chain
MRSLSIAVRTCLLTLLVTGLLYPLAVTGISRVLFPHEAGGSLVEAEGRVVGSELIAQPFADPGYFWPRPSAAGEQGFDAANSSGSNLGPTSKALRERATAEAERLRAANPGTGPVPLELLATSGSGLDPHLSPEAAFWQVPRIAAARNVDPARIGALVESRVEGRTFGFLGEPRVNVLLLDVALDRQFPRAR